jgi:hypothetical protein
MAVVPDGCVDVIWIDGELIVAGPDIVVSVSPITPGPAIVGMRFRAGAARRWLGLPMSHILGERVALSEFWGVRANEIARRIGTIVDGGAVKGLRRPSLGRAGS